MPLLRDDGAASSSSSSSDDGELETLLGGPKAGRGRAPGWGARGSALADHWAAASLFCSPRYRVPMCVVWATALGGAMHEPAVPFFYLSLGLTAAQIGQAGGILTAGSLLLAPVYGWIFDKHSSLLALVIAISLCGGGCLLRALATGPPTVLLAALVMSVDGSFESLVLAFVARDQPAKAGGGVHGGLCKGAVISAFLFQVQACRIAGRGLYPAWNWGVRAVLGTRDDDEEAHEPGVGVGASQLLRYRIVLASCVVPCVLGFVALLLLCLGRCPAPPTTPTPVAMAAVPAADRGGSGQQAAGVAARRRGGGWCAGAALGVSLFAQGAVTALTYTVWPLFLRAHFRLDDDGFAPLLLASSLAAALAVLAVPSLQRWLRGGAMRSAAIAATGAGLLTPLAFAVQCPASALPLHSALTLLGIGCAAWLDTALKSAASESLPRGWQGSVFGAAASLTGLGSVTANVLGTMLYQNSFASISSHQANASQAEAAALAGPVDCGGGGLWVGVERAAVGAGGELPFQLIGALLLVAASGLVLAA